MQVYKIVRYRTEGWGFERRQTKTSMDCCKGQVHPAYKLDGPTGPCEVVVQLVDKKIEVTFPRFRSG